MADKFNPEEHWTSSRRTRAGIAPPANCDSSSAFTIRDTQGTWTEIVARSGYPEAGAWRSRPPTWHIEVKTTRGPLAEEFTLSAAQFDKASSPKPQTPLSFPLPQEFAVLFRSAQTKICLSNGVLGTPILRSCSRGEIPDPGGRCSFDEGVQSGAGAAAGHVPGSLGALRRRYPPPQVLWDLHRPC
jgi:hypothetical protein